MSPLNELNIRQSLLRHLRPEVRTLATRLNSESKAALLSFFRHNPGTAMTAADLAFQIRCEGAEVEQDLADLVGLGLVDCVRCGDLVFYRLTAADERLAALEEVVAWQAHWVERTRRLAQAVGALLL